MRTRAPLALAMAIGVALCACATSAPPPRAAVGPARARELVARFEARQAEFGRDDPLHRPASLDDVLEILRRDQIDLFPDGIAFAARQPGLEALALHAQLELAWGEALLVLARTFDSLSRDLRAQERRRAAREAAGGEVDDAERTRLRELRALIGEREELADALGQLAVEHVGRGARIAGTVLEQEPSSYRGYSLAADYYRMRGDWGRFADMLRLIERTNPDSNGLVFLRGTAALYRTGDRGAARAHFRDALARDPKFARAQVQLVLAAGHPRETLEELEKLRAINPRHQLVVWAGDAVERAAAKQGQ